MPDNANILNKEFLHTKIIKEIISLIASGVYSNGQRLPAERKLCEKFAASRGTIRQSLADLEKLGVIKIKPGSGAYVQKFSYSKLPPRLLPPDFGKVCLSDIIEARQVIELAAIELACNRITKKQLCSLSKLVDDMARQIGNLPDFLESDLNFHQLIVRASGNRVLSTAFEAIAQYHKYSLVFTSLNGGEEKTALDYHRKILDTLHKADKKLCRKIMNQHLSNMAKYNNKPISKT